MQHNKKNKLLSIIVGMVLVCVWMIFFLNEEFVLVSSDIYPHYVFALQIPRLFSVGVKAFMEQTSNAHIISYPAWHILFIMIHTILNTLFGIIKQLIVAEDAVSLLAQAIENTLLLLLTFQCVKRIFDKKNITIWAAALMMFAGPLYASAINSNYYLGQLTGNPWHNPTTFIIKPLAVVSFFLFVSTLEHREKEAGKENISFIIFSALLLLSAICKPNFYQVFVPALFAFCVIDVLVTKGKSFLFDVKTGLAVLPVCIWALLQFRLSFVLSGNGGICLNWLMVWREYTPHILGSLLLSLAFPIYVYVLSYKEIVRNRMLLLNLCTLVSGILQFCSFSLVTKATTGDFIWGCYLAVFLTFMVSVIQLNAYKIEKGKNIRYWIGLGLFVCHGIMGIGYFICIYLKSTWNI